MRGSGLTGIYVIYFIRRGSQTVLGVELQGMLATRQNGRRGSAGHISAGRTSCTQGKFNFEGGFVLLGTKRVS